MGNKTVWIALLALLGVLSGFALSIRPWQKYQEEKRQAAAAKTEMRAVEAEKSELLKQQAKLDSSLGREELARQRGYKKPAEEVWEPK